MEGQRGVVGAECGVVVGAVLVAAPGDGIEGHVAEESASLAEGVGVEAVAHAVAVAVGAEVAAVRTGGGVRHQGFRGNHR